MPTVERGDAVSLHAIRNVLVVDDEEHILSSIERLLMDVDNIRVLKTLSPLDALDMVRENEVAAIVTDNLMPEMKGMELLKKVRAVSPDTVRILMTAYADLPTAIEAINSNEVFRFIIKPWENEVLENAILDGVNRYSVIESLQDADEGTLLSIAQTIELKDPYTRGHCDRVAAYALLIADRFGIDEAKQKQIKYGCWLHDCGKIGVPESVLNFNGRLSENEMKVILNHPTWGGDILKHVKVSDEVRNIVLCHHERFDGKGYPAGTCSTDIPIEARIASIADVYDALYTDRPYRKGHPKEKVMAIMKGMRGTFFDPELFDIFLTIIAEQGDEVAKKQDGPANKDDE